MADVRRRARQDASHLGPGGHCLQKGVRPIQALGVHDGNHAQSTTVVPRGSWPRKSAKNLAYGLTAEALWVYKTRGTAGALGFRRFRFCAVPRVASRESHGEPRAARALSPTARRRSHRRSLPHPGRSALHPAPRRSRRGRHQDRAPRRRRRHQALGTAVRGRRRRVLPLAQPQQAVHDGRSRDAGGGVVRPPADRERGRRHREFPTGPDGAVRARSRGAAARASCVW